MSGDASTDPFVRYVADQLARCADPATKSWWERYLKGTATFRGVKMATTRRIVNDAVSALGVDVDDPDVILAHLCNCAQQPFTEDKLAGVLLVAEHGLGALDISHVDHLARPLACGDLADWNTVDWYCVKVLGPFVVAGTDIEERCREVTAWVNADALWQRRAGLVAFVNHCATEPELFPGFTDLVFDAAETNATDSARFSQTSVGWALRELAARVPDRVRAFVDAHPELSNEARKNALKNL